MKEMLSRVSVPGRIFDLLWVDDEFYREVSGNKKISSSGKFPRCDQWCDEKGFYIAFALAGYSPSDVDVSAENNMLLISGLGANSTGKAVETVAEKEDDEYPTKSPNLGVQQGMIVRGIARRNFKAKYFVHSDFDLSLSTASMKDGMLEIFVPRGKSFKPIKINVKEK
jgi:HSP20 family molecular chaperone IbpA